MTNNKTAQGWDEWGLMLGQLKIERKSERQAASGEYSQEGWRHAVRTEANFCMLSCFSVQKKSKSSDEVTIQRKRGKVNDVSLWLKLNYIKLMNIHVNVWHHVHLFILRVQS